MKLSCQQFFFSSLYTYAPRKNLNLHNLTQQKAPLFTPTPLQTSGLLLLVISLSGFILAAMASRRGLGSLVGKETQLYGSHCEMNLQS
jgi:hypothetical protein